MSEEILQAKKNLMNYIQTFLKKFNRISFRETPKVLSQAWEKFFEIQHAQPEDTNEFLRKLLEDLKIIKSDKVIKSSVKNLVPIPSEFEVTFDNENTLIDSSPKFDFLLEEFSGELTHIDPIPPGIEEADFDLEKEIQIVDMIVESLSPSPILVVDSDSKIEEIDLFLDTNDLMPPSIENENYDSEGDIYFLKELLRELISAVMNNINELIEDECFDPGGGEIDVFSNVEDDDYFPFIFFIRIFLPYLTYPEVSPLLLSAGSEDTIFDLGIYT
nr:hypothetical protein [Tanacetum cinerariifolium]